MIPAAGKPVVVAIVGTRPEFIKLAPWVAVFSRLFNFEVWTTGQHTDNAMSWDILNDLGYVPSRSFEIYWNLEEQLQRQLHRELSFFEAVVVVGDTNSALYGARAARAANKLIIHLEAGCRSGNSDSVEEKNRLEIDRLSHLLIAPDEEAKTNLLAEGVPREQILLSAGMGFFPVLHAAAKVSAVSKEINIQVADFFSQPGKKVLVTLHRRETISNKAKLKGFISNLEEIAEFAKVCFVCHPHTEKKIREFEMTPANSIFFVKPFSFLPMIDLLGRSDLLITDSGGMQEEGFALGLPVLVARTETEWNRLQQYPGMKLCPAYGKSLPVMARALLRLNKETLKERRSEEIPKAIEPIISATACSIEKFLLFGLSEGTSA